eukprot:TRINITY_DN1862_c0_g2_i3.p1 TRINITY_DN1862_c0_g2~~TRINITY_DN1862_c0_g2_i3.p1  ORF type:complete len:194 (+),score=91.76 TRINITY_DN1862_c0_g2_i3:64-582(+)
MSAEKVTQPIEDEDVPTLEAADDNEPEMDGRTGGKQGKRYAKAMAKMGLKPEPNILRVQIRKHQGLSFAISKPEVYRFPGTNTFVIFGETQLEETGNDAQKAAARTIIGETKTEEAAAAPAAEADDDEDAGSLQDKEITVVMSQANVSRGKAIRALKNNNGDIVNAIMELTM